MKRRRHRRTTLCYTKLRSFLVQREVAMDTGDCWVINIELTTSKSTSGSSLQQPLDFTFSHNGQKLVPTIAINPQAPAENVEGGQVQVVCRSLQEIEALTLLDVEEATTRDGKALKIGLETLQKDLRVQQKRIDGKEKQSSQIKNEIYQLVGLFIVFQGVLYTAIAQAQVLDCRNWTTVFVLSLLASAAAIAWVSQKLRELDHLRETIKNEELYPKVLKKWIEKARTEGLKYFDSASKQGQAEMPDPPHHFFTVYNVMVLLTLTLFAATFGTSFYFILCRE